MDVFNRVVEIYDKYYKELLSSGKLTVRDTSKGIWGVSGTKELIEFFPKIELKGKKFLDIGSGDGKAVIIAALYGAEAYGVEIDKELVEKSNIVKKELGVGCEFFCSDLFDLDFSSYDVFFINPDQRFDQLERKLIEEMKPTAVLYVYNNIFKPRFLKQGKRFWVGQTPITAFSR